jgi:hypothetical protein
VYCTEDLREYSIYGSTFESTFVLLETLPYYFRTEVVLPYVLFMKVGGSFVQSTCARTTYDRIHVRPHVKRGVWIAVSVGRLVAWLFYLRRYLRIMHTFGKSWSYFIVADCKSVYLTLAVHQLTRLSEDECSCSRDVRFASRPLTDVRVTQRASRDPYAVQNLNARDVVPFIFATYNVLPSKVARNKEVPSEILPEINAVV